MLKLQQDTQAVTISRDELRRIVAQEIAAFFAAERERRVAPLRAPKLNGSTPFDGKIVDGEREAEDAGREVAHWKEATFAAQDALRDASAARRYHDLRRLEAERDSARSRASEAEQRWLSVRSRLVALDAARQAWRADRL